MQYRTLSDQDALALLSEFQHGFPLLARPFAAMAARLSLAEDAVLQALRGFRASGQIGRTIGRNRAGTPAAQAMRSAPARTAAWSAPVITYQRFHSCSRW